ncbi:MAG: hypothetical protein ABI834_07945 [Ginsengibacter sp.]
MSKFYAPGIVLNNNFFYFNRTLKPDIMKNLIFSFIVLAAVSCNTSTVKETPNMPGAYLMTSQTVNDGKKDTKYTTLKQLKIYADNYFMYAQVNPADSVSSFGVGSYTSDTGTVIENVIYSSNDTAYTTTPANYKLNIAKSQDGYEQVIPEITINSQKSKLTEVYQTVGSTAKTPLDGVWKEINSYTLKGSDTSKSVQTQYKTFYAGYFMFGHTVKDSVGKNHTGIGFGTFEMVGNNKVKETDLNSTYSIIAGQSFDIDIEMNGTDNYKQTITNADGTKSVEFYERLKK